MKSLLNLPQKNSFLLSLYSVTRDAKTHFEKICLSAGLLFLSSKTIWAQSGSVSSAEDNTWWYLTLGVLFLLLGGVVVYWFQQKAKAKENAHTNKRLPANPTFKQSTRAERRLSDNKEVVAGGKNGKTLKNVENYGSANGAKERNGNSSFYELEPHALSAQAVKIATAAAQNDPQSNWKLNHPSKFQPLPLADDESVLDAYDQICDGDKDDEAMRGLSTRVLSAYRTQNSVEGLSLVALYDASSKLRVEAVQALGNFDHESVFEPVLLACADPAREVRAAAARVLTRLSFNRADAFVRVIESGDQERVRLAALACIESGFAARGFERLSADDPKQSYEAFAILSLLVKAENFEPILQTIERHPNLSVRLATVKALDKLKPAKMLNQLHNLTMSEDLLPDVKTAIEELIYHLGQPV